MNYSKPVTGSVTFYELADERAEIDGNKLPYGGKKRRSAHVMAHKVTGNVSRSVFNEVYC